MAENAKVDPRAEKRDRRFLAFVLIVVGLIALLSNFITIPENVGLVVLAGFGIVLLAYGLFAWRYGYTIPGCIITGLGIGVLIAEPNTQLSGNVEGGIIVLGLAGGFIGIAVMNVLFSKPTFWWPLVPGVILGVVGALLTIDTTTSMNLLEQIGRFWPIILLLIGVSMLLRHDEGQRTQE